MTNRFRKSESDGYSAPPLSFFGNFPLAGFDQSQTSYFEPSAVNSRLLALFKKSPQKVIRGDVLKFVAGTEHWAARIRDLRNNSGWLILCGLTVTEMVNEREFQLEETEISTARSNDYVLVSNEQDRLAVYRWRLAKQIRRESEGSICNNILRFLKDNAGIPVSGEELRYIAGGKTGWLGRIRELRNQGCQILTQRNERPDLPLGMFLMQ